MSSSNVLLFFTTFFASAVEAVEALTIVLAVGVLLTSFGVFWGGEGAGVAWPGSDLAVLGIVGFLALVSFVLVRTLHRRRLALEPVVNRA